MSVSLYRLLRVAGFALLPAGAVSAGGIFWTNRGASLVERAGFDGAGRVTVLAAAGTNLRGLALDLLNERIYYADNGGDVLYRMALDGTGRTVVASVGPAAFPADIRLDVAAGHLYYCDQQKAVVRRMSLDGGEPVTLVTDAVHQPYYLDLDRVNGKIYWGDFDGESANTGHVFRMNFDGSARETVVTGTLETRGVGVDPAGGMLYWVNRNAGRVQRCPLGALPVDAASSPAVETLYENLDTPHGLQLDVPAGKLYWVDTATNGTPGTVGDRAVSRGGLDGRGPHEVLVEVGSEPWDVDIDPRCLSYAEWVARHFPVGGRPAASGTADPENDGLSNVLEYGLGRHPLRVDSTGLVETGVLRVGGRDYPTLSFNHRTGAADLIVLPQQSFDLGAWWDETSPDDGIPRLVEISRAALPENMERVTVRSVFSLQDAPQQWLRVRVISGAGG